MRLARFASKPASSLDNGRRRVGARLRHGLCPVVAAMRPCVPTYRRREPERTVLYRTLSGHLETFLAEDEPGGRTVPRFVERELRKFLRCGILADGFARVRCTACGDDLVVACKGRGFCPSCGGRRMADTAARLVDRVLPHVPVRQWVLTLPVPLRYRVAFDASLRRGVRRVFLRAVFTWLRRKARRRGVTDGQAGGLCVEQRWGSALNLNPHFHALVLDGVFTRLSRDRPPMFYSTPAPTDDEVAHLVWTIRTRVLRLLARRGLGGLLGDDGYEVPDPLAEDTPLLAACAAASVTGRVALGPAAGLGTARLRTAELARAVTYRAARCAELGGFNLHAAVHLPAGARARLERLCRYVLRPSIATERLSSLPDGRLLYALRRPWSDGTTHVMFEPLDFLARLCALVPAPHRNLVTYHGVLASHAKWRALVVPRPPGETTVAADADEASFEPGPGSPPRAGRPSSCSPRRLSWAELLKRTFEVDVLECHRCGGRRELIALITQRETAQKILHHLGLPAESPHIDPARAPPQRELGFEGEAAYFPA